jgi:isopentenyldiphosphate isomerase
MSSDELLDLVNENDEVVGSVWKSEAHKDNRLTHREVAVALFTKNGEVLLQQRSMKKETGKGEWKVSVAGHVAFGEDPEKAAEREVFEELGIKI